MVKGVNSMPIEKSVRFSRISYHVTFNRAHWSPDQYSHWWQASEVLFVWFLDCKVPLYEDTFYNSHWWKILIEISNCSDLHISAFKRINWSSKHCREGGGGGLSSNQIKSSPYRTSNVHIGDKPLKYNVGDKPVQYTRIVWWYILQHTLVRNLISDISNCSDIHISNEMNFLFWWLCHCGAFFIEIIGEIILIY